MVSDQGHQATILDQYRYLLRLAVEAGDEDHRSLFRGLAAILAAELDTAVSGPPIEPQSGTGQQSRANPNQGSTDSLDDP